MMPHESLEHKYGFLPKAPEHIVEQMMQEVNDFATLTKHDFEGARETVSQDIEWLRENKDFLGKAVEASVNSALELYGEKLSHTDWISLQTLLLKGQLLVLQLINESLREKHA
jgi:hypothetical protein